ncbi:hypothetical protein PIB30_030504 [Stylosanthes scabra]|uniref:Uncharacterized protein n=1 Tax=Stylosanthes scabra TaxID=79078 RepID=A0ABU6XBA2_9FABA|nr:hypothetical protein [Stylosanthes scabra]
MNSSVWRLLLLTALHRYRLRQEDDIVLIQSWHNHFPTIHLLELFAVFADVGDSGFSDVGVDTQSSGGAETNNRRLMVNLNMPRGGSIENSNPEADVPTEGILEEEIKSHEKSLTGDSMTYAYRVNPTISNDEEVEDEIMSGDEEAIDDEDMHEKVPPRGASPLVLSLVRALARRPTRGFRAGKSPSSGCCNSGALGVWPGGKSGENKSATWRT